jgi:Icc-related predicted phosphoesterase
LILGGDILIASELKDFAYDENAEIVMATSSVRARAKRYVDFINRCCERFKQVIYITGNHESYHGDFAETYKIIKGTFGDIHNLHILDNEWRIINGVLFFGGTLWTDMNGEDPVTMSHITGTMNDYRQIKNTGPNAGGRFLPQDSVEEHYRFRRNLDEALAMHPGLPVVMCCHHAPSRASTHPRYKTEYIINGAYSTDMDNWILDRRQIKLITHGHTHEDFDYMIGTTRVVCNPRGYDGYEERADRFQLKYVEI